MRRRSMRAMPTLAVAVAVLLTACGGPTTASPGDAPLTGATQSDVTPTEEGKGGPGRTVTLAFAGDLHFEGHLAALLDHPRGALGPITGTLADADVTMANLESAITVRGTPEAKELEDPGNRYHFRTTPAALEVLAEAGVDVVTMANNHGADYGPVGVEDTLRAIRNGPIPVVGIGRNRRAAFAPYRVSVRGTSLAFFGADASFREERAPSGPPDRRRPASPPPTPAATGAAGRGARGQPQGRRRRGVPALGRRAPGLPHRPAADDRSRPGRGRRRRHRGQPCPRAAGGRTNGRCLCELRPRELLWYHDHQPESGVLRLRIVDGAGRQ